MFGSINSQFSAAKNTQKNDDFIVESVLEVDAILPGSDDELEDQVDVESVPDDVYRRVDAELDKIVSSPDYDDTEIEEMVDDDDEISDAEIDAVITEACGAWVDDDNINHPNVALRSENKHQPQFRGCGQKSL